MPNGNAASTQAPFPSSTTWPMPITIGPRLQNVATGLATLHTLVRSTQPALGALSTLSECHNASNTFSGAPHIDSWLLGASLMPFVYHDDIERRGRSASHHPPLAYRTHHTAASRKKRALVTAGVGEATAPSCARRRASLISLWQRVSHSH